MPQDIKREDVQTLSNPDQIATFFLKLGYDVGTRVVSSAQALGITGDVSHAIKHVERVASLNDGYEIQVYVFQLQGRSVTMTTQKAISRAFRDRAGDYLMVLTTNYEQIDFMLVERSNAEAGMMQKEIIGLQPPIHRVGGASPRFLTVNRSNPGSVALRVLRLFSYTGEKSVFEQSERLRNAYDVAYWSEEYFNNRALFSDYYLKERLPEERGDWKKPSNQESAARKRVQGALSKLYDDAQDEYANKSAQEVRSQLIEPVLELLGFKAQVVKTKKGVERTADYALYATDTFGKSLGEKPRAVCLAYSWQRDLDRQVDEREDPETFDENPGAVVVTLLDKGEADWAILTNGKMWRLYAAKAHSRATNYYEIDLEDIVISNVADREEAFKYFWFLFRYDSFLPTENNGTRSLVDALLSESDQYARRLGDRLKNRIFEDVFHHFAQGFVNYAQEQKMLPTNLDSLTEEERERRLKPYFDGTLTFLYRLLFLLYAESRNLLPVRETDSYYQVSLEKLKNDIKERVGESVTDAPGRIRYNYDSTSTTLYDTLQTVFHAVDKGDKDLNVPIYNGGLFMTEPYLLDTSAEAEVAQFLRTHKIPDQYLALGFDLMARDEDDKKSGLVFVDYKSLGVRQLGSIYEGLLEFKLRVAMQAMTVVKMEKNKKTEKIIPYEEARAKKLAIVKERHEGAYRERVYNLNDVYLENDRSERKATGSYYTPDYIVKYIVQNTVGPVLDQNLETLRNTFEEAEKTLGINKQMSKAREQQKIQPGNPEEKTYQHYEHTLNEQFFDLKVLDPAMGSGHFLVEAVDFITDKMIRFLQGFPWNPVMYHLGKIRADIQREMEQQDISIDVSKLTPINLLKRQVLKRCIYGVDLNPMAVELAKVSVWLDSFTLGAPLSFLDHHLKCGNSLIGGSIREVEDVLRDYVWSNEFARLLSGTHLMRLLSERSDITVRDVNESRTFYAEAVQMLQSYKILMNLWVSEYFGNRGGQKTVSVYLKSIIDNDYSELNKIDLDAVNIAQSLAEQKNKNFFHWDLEFPEVFFDEKQRKQENKAGFDVVVGNPPYDVYTSKGADKTYMSDMAYFEVEKMYKSALGGQVNIFRLFLVKAVNVLRDNGIVGEIIPMSILSDRSTKNTRKNLLATTHFLRIEAFPQKDDEKNRVFEEAKLSTCILITKKDTDISSFIVRTHIGKFIDKHSPEIIVNPNDIQIVDEEEASIPATNPKTWSLLIKLYSQKTIIRLDTIASCNRGEVSLTFSKDYLTKNSTDATMLKGVQVGRYIINNRLSQGEVHWLDEARYRLQAEHSQRLELVKNARVALQRITGVDDRRRVFGTVIPKNIFLAESANSVALLNNDYNLYYIIALLNSQIIDWRFRVTSTNNNVSSYELDSLPVRNITFSTPTTERNFYKDEGKILYRDGISKDNEESVLEFVKQHLEAERSDVVHDVLAFLAAKMLQMNREKQNEQQRFLAVTVELLKIRPDKDGKEGIDALVNKQRIAEYPGEYQKGTPELKFEELFDLLYKNKARLGVSSLETVKSTLRDEYKKSLKIVGPLVQQLKYTDELIDSVVYALYGLTQDEIDVVEGKAKVVDSNV